MILCSCHTSCTTTTTTTEAGLPFPTLRLLAPPVRLVAAAVWRTVTRRDVLQYGAAEEFVTSVCDSVPGMLTFRHQGKLTLGLRGRVSRNRRNKQTNKQTLIPLLLLLLLFFFVVVVIEMMGGHISEPCQTYHLLFLSQTSFRIDHIVVDLLLIFMVQGINKEQLFNFNLLKVKSSRHFGALGEIRIW